MNANPLVTQQEGWTCGRCSLKNEAGSKRCAMCDWSLWSPEKKGETQLVTGEEEEKVKAEKKSREKEDQTHHPRVLMRRESQRVNGTARPGAVYRSRVLPKAHSGEAEIVDLRGDDIGRARETEAGGWRVVCTTFNVGNKRVHDAEMAQWFDGCEGADVVAVALQEANYLSSSQKRGLTVAGASVAAASAGFPVTAIFAGTLVGAMAVHSHLMPKIRAAIKKRNGKPKKKDEPDEIVFSEEDSSGDEDNLDDMATQKGAEGTPMFYLAIAAAIDRQLAPRGFRREVFAEYGQLRLIVFVHKTVTVDSTSQAKHGIGNFFNKGGLAARLSVSKKAHVQGHPQHTTKAAQQVQHPAPSVVQPKSAPPQAAGPQSFRFRREAPKADTVSDDRARLTVAFVGAHLPAHEGKKAERVAALDEIWATVAPVVENADLTALCGDLNFRLHNPESAEREKLTTSGSVVSRLPETHLASDCKTNLSFGKVVAAVQAGELKMLHAYDELLEELKTSETLAGFATPSCDFPPTFKLVRKTDDYNPKRLPAWCDRVLFRVRAAAFRRVDILRYLSHPEVTSSDHKPVTLDLLVLPNDARVPRLARKGLPVTAFARRRPSRPEASGLLPAAQSASASSGNPPRSGLIRDDDDPPLIDLDRPSELVVSPSRPATVRRFDASSSSSSYPPGADLSPPASAPP